jgi:hypothetical protein
MCMPGLRVEDVSVSPSVASCMTYRLLQCSIPVEHKLALRPDGADVVGSYRGKAKGGARGANELRAPPGAFQREELPGFMVR